MGRNAVVLFGLGAAIAAVLLVTGCANSRSILYSGISGPLGENKVVVSDARAVHDAREFRAEWRAMIGRTARQAKSESFSSLSDRRFRLRLASAADRYSFTLKAVQFLHRRQVTPLVIVQSRHYLAFARAVPAIEHSLDPHRGRNDSRGWTYRAFLLEAQDERGVPFLLVSNVVASSGVTGGQWARSDLLFPFARS